MKIKHRRVPWQAAIVENPPRLAFEVGNHVLVANLEHRAQGQHVPPVRHDPLVRRVIAPELAEIESKRHVSAEKLGEAGEAGIDRVAQAVDEARAGNGHVDQADGGEIHRRLVGDEARFAGGGRNAPEIVVPEGADFERRRTRKRIGKICARRAVQSHCSHRRNEIGSFAAAVHERMARQHLLDERRAGTRHADDEDRLDRRRPEDRPRRRKGPREARANAVERPEYKPLIVFDLLPPESVALDKVSERLFGLCQFGERLAQREVNEDALPARQPRQVVGKREEALDHRIASHGAAVPQGDVERPGGARRVLRHALEQPLRLGELAAFLERLAERQQKVGIFGLMGQRPAQQRERLERSIPLAQQH